MSLNISILSRKIVINEEKLGTIIIIYFIRIAASYMISKNVKILINELDY